ncbi:MAG: hypothetical protein LBQ31_03470 [Bacteroidales bacterium]|nr:hypothetical protein [Bacteroidales bacterium]
MQGNQTQKISEALENYSTNPLKNSKKYQELLARYNVASYISDYGGGDIRMFLDNCQMYYGYQDNEVIVSNEAYPYSYVLSFPNSESERMTIHKITEDVKNILNQYPLAFATSPNNKIIYEVGTEVEPQEDAVKKLCLVQTNAIKMTDKDEFKRVRRMILKMHADKFENDEMACVALFVSNNATDWLLADNREWRASNTNGQMINDFPPMGYVGTYKYIALLAIGTYSAATDYISNFLVDVEVAYNNKAR